MDGSSRGPASGPHPLFPAAGHAPTQDPIPLRHEPLSCIAPHWARWKTPVLAVLGVVFAVCGFFGTYSLIGLRATVREQADKLYMPKAMAEGLWEKQAAADEKRDAALALLAQQLVLQQVQQATQGRDLTWLVRTLDDHVRSGGEKPATPAPAPLPVVTPPLPAPPPQTGTAAPATTPTPTGGTP